MANNNVLTNRGDFVRIFVDGVKIDKSLPKYSQKNENIVSKSVIDMMETDAFEFNTLVGIPNMTSLPFNGDTWGDQRIEYGNIKGWLIAKIIQFGNKKKEEEKPEIDIIEFFSRVKLESEEIGKNYYDRIKPYLKQLNNAKALGQTALYDELMLRIMSIKYESLLVAGGFTKRISEEQLVKFVKMTEKGLRLDYISNFGRPIPENIVELKQKADNLCVFDNYVVLHYDPDAKAYKQTEEEKKQERKKKADPILFGVISGIKNLYFIGDWIDEYCDLTLDQFMQVANINTDGITLDTVIDFKKK